MQKKPSIVFAMRYPDNIGVVWASMGRIYDAVAERLAGSYCSVIAYPQLTGMAVYQPDHLRPVSLDLYDTSAKYRDAIRQFLDAEQVRAIVYFGCDPSTIDLAFVRAGGIRTINYDQDSYPVTTSQPIWKWATKAITRRVLQRNIHDLYVANADHQRQFLLRHAALPPGRVAIVANGVDPIRFSPGPMPNPVELGLPVARQYVVSVCQARPEKRIDFLIEIAAEYAKRYPTAGATFVHVGDGPALADWIAKANALGLGDRFAFAGGQTNVAPFHRLASVYAHCAERESFGFAVAEAMATGVPVVAADSPGPAELLCGGVGGVIVPQNQSVSFVEAIHKYLSNDQLRTETGAAGRKRIEQKYTLDRQADELATAILSVIG